MQPPQEDFNPLKFNYRKVDKALAERLGEGFWRGSDNSTDCLSYRFKEKFWRPEDLFTVRVEMLEKSLRIDKSTAQRIH